MRTDVLIDDNYEQIDTGLEWAEGESDDQHVQLLMLANKGEFKEFPFVGFGAPRRLNGIFNKNKIVRDIRVELENDGYNDYTLRFKAGLKDFEITL